MHHQANKMLVALLSSQLHRFHHPTRQLGEAKHCKRLCLWSSPRNVSTALMYSFAQRCDTVVYDEPLYPHYLRETGAERPDRELTMRVCDTDGERVVHAVLLGPHPRPVAFFKLMPHFLVGLDRAFLKQCKHVLLVRDPGLILASYTQVVTNPTMQDISIYTQVVTNPTMQDISIYTQVVTNPTMQDIGMQDLKDLYLELSAGPSGPPPVIDAEFLLRDPRRVLAQLCTMLEIPFTDAMLSWRAGPRKEDGPWAPYWYHNLHNSTGFAPWSERPVPPVPAGLHALWQACQQPYQFLRERALRP
eukprot:g72019.t1